MSDTNRKTPPREEDGRRPRFVREAPRTKRHRFPTRATLTAALRDREDY